MVEIKLGGEVRNMRFSHIAIKSLENHYKIPFHDVFKKVNIDSIENIGVMLWASLRKFEKGLTLDEVEDMLDDDIEDGHLTYGEVGEKIREVFEASTIAQEGKKKQEKNKKGA